ncbi:hypothetical protein AN2292.2 [Aspergillus nidulans FGSC A4]|uniref:Protein FAF1 n=1 Tax=Emericella nidulans (strain FGSC A4 / ATCC 38163 / CBS 112.46 / NRRL 194 / M139) TaxID=227321 RepID=Q5BAY8_EMENI|nr:hypothetical protein [Aspergillus nidulans FGSC A4]EAA64403.1 hypothetical protein AN2292.2 [Aspergillus nidulans FGSC A4]CBF86546.1 TPA: conserved hypothetical protein [Aspergillus nidulans FGSC A4]|eukprot:XP_659896.1 hypothetical protein AN2292.2 [Aspergillus nidulans FGSC A4]
MVGKRKRDTSEVSGSEKGGGQQETPATAESSAQDIFRKFFEAQFQPLEVKRVNTAKNESDSEYTDNEHDGNSQEDDSASESEWSGIEEQEENTPVEVVEYQAPSRSPEDLIDKKARKAFMTAKPPSFSMDLNPITDSSKKATNDEDDKDIESLNLKNDLALQRLLKESHLLESASDLAPTGKNRHKALDLRMQELGAKNSLYHQKNMPSSIRKGIKAKAVSKEDKRRREARENGIILEKPAPKKQISSGRRERGVGGPSIGKFAGGTLNLSSRDVAHVQGSRRGGGKSRGRGKTRGRR